MARTRDQIKAIKAKQGRKLQGEWFKGNVFRGNFTADMLVKAKEKYEKDVKQPTALRTKTIKGKEFSQFFFKPIQVGEFTD